MRSLRLPSSPPPPQSHNSFSSCRRKTAKYACLLLSSLFIYTEIRLISRLSLTAPISDQEEISPLKLQQNHFDNAKKQQRPPDGTFNGLPVHLQSISNLTYTKPKSLLHCVAEDYQPDNWMLRSCHFKFMCFNLDTKEYQIYSRPEDVNLKEWSDQRPLMDLQETLIHRGTTVSLGGIRRDWDSATEANRLEYFPSILSTPPSTFYTLPENVVMVPFHSTAGWDPLQLLWDDFVSVFSLMYIFQLQDYIPLVLRHVLPGDGLPGSCDDKTKQGDCEKVLRKFFPLMMRPPSILTSQLEAELQLDSNQQPKSNLVCAKHGLIGTGALTDHGTHKTNGWNKANEGIAHNHGRGDLFWKFRGFCLKNLGLDDTTRVQAPYKILFAISSSTKRGQNLDYLTQEGVLKQSLDSKMASIESYIWKDLSLFDQVRLASEASVFITVYGEEATAATFLPRGATLILFYDEEKSTGGLALQNWDLFNNLSYLRVHWFPIGTIDTDEDSKTLLRVVKDALSNQLERDRV
jgi:hypothetical protein